MIASGKPARQAGLTLIELLVTLAVIVIVSTIAVPGFQNLVATSRLTADHNELLVGLHLARSEAVKRREEVTAVVTRQGESGWRLEVKVDDGTSLANIDCTDSTENQCLLYRNASASPVGLSASSASQVTFNSLGRLVGGSCQVVDLGHQGNSESIKIGLTGRIGKSCA
ncbi:GspH/FimT family pseudopilin [Modicisalibacter luteus]|uniref:Type II secretion system protein H n=1 Tax=Modicisalibacter luteus TaxID=453962 RepID=A0ABV7LW89_9GAMM|nr:GspH/FimT family pseudopilin [Halomonas lutea]